MKSSQQSKDARLRSAAIVKLKYRLLTGEFDHGFRVVFDGVLSDLGITEEEVDGYIDQHREELSQICLQGS